MKWTSYLVSLAAAFFLTTVLTTGVSRLSAFDRTSEVPTPAPWHFERLAVLPTLDVDGVTYGVPQRSDSHLWIAGLGRIFAGHGLDRIPPIFEYDLNGRYLRRYGADKCHEGTRSIIPTSLDSVIVTHFSPMMIENGSICVSAIGRGVNEQWPFTLTGVAPAYGASLGQNVLLIDPPEQSDPGHIELFTRRGVPIRSFSFKGWVANYIRACSLGAVWISFRSESGYRTMFVHLAEGGTMIRKYPPIRPEEFFCRDNGDLIGTSESGGSTVEISTQQNGKQRLLVDGSTPKTDMIDGEMLLESSKTLQLETRVGTEVPESIERLITSITALGHRRYAVIANDGGSFSLDVFTAPD